MIISNLNSWNHATANQNSALNRPSSTATTTETNKPVESSNRTGNQFITKDIYDKTAPRTIVFCKIKAPEVFNKVPNNTSMKLKKLSSYQLNHHL